MDSLRTKHYGSKKLSWRIDNLLANSLTTGEMMRISLVLLRISLLHVPGEVVG
jgi:hypothetical protein